MNNLEKLLRHCLEQNMALMKWNEEAEESKAQRLRNMRAAGLATA